MELVGRLCTFLLICISCTEERIPGELGNNHIPPSHVPTFQRGSVESAPRLDSYSDSIYSSYMKYHEFGTRSLPLRSAVENVPDIIESSQRLPLRDAVEKRPLPESYRIAGKPQPEPYDQVDFSQQYDPYSNTNQDPYFIYNPYSDVYFNQQQPQSFHTPLYLFQNILADYRSAPPYRIDNSNQRLIVNPYSLPIGRSLRTGKDIKEKTNDVTNKIVCYVEGVAAYRKEPLTFNPEDLDPFICTHVIYSYATIDPLSYQITSNDEEYDVVQGGYRAVVGLKRRNPKLKVLIAIGGSREDGSHRFSSLVSNARRRRTFIRSALPFLRNYGFDGMEIHWEYPGDEDVGGQSTDKENLIEFLEELNEIFKVNGWLLAISVPSSRFRSEDGFDPSKLGSLVDFVNLQAYDFHSERELVADHPANLYPRNRDTGLNMFLSVDYAVRFWLRKGLPNHKLVLGVPAFGRSFTLKSANNSLIGAPIQGPGHEGFYTQTPGALAYFEICDTIANKGGKKGQDDIGSPYLVNGDQWIGYDDEHSIRKKVQYAKQQQLAGIAVYAADLDDFKGLCGERWPLLTAINKEIKGITAISFKENHGLPIRPFGKCESNGYYSDSKNCAAYYICKNGLSYHLSCGSNLMFNPENGKCENVTPGNCKPGETIYIASNLKGLDFLERSEEIRAAKPKVVCYMTNWAFYRKAEGKFVPEHIDQRLCTHVLYAFASLEPKNLLLKEFDPWADLDNNLYERVTSLQDTTVLLSLGGWTDSAGDKYSRLVSDGSARRRFVVGTVGFLRKHGFKGLHFDWNYPICWQSDCKKGPSSDKPNFTKLIQELRKEFAKQSPPMVLAVSISGYKEVIDVAYDLSELGKAVDFLSVMTYDYHGAWERQTGHVSPLYSKPGDKYPQYTTNFTMEYLVSLGAPREKLLVGVPFYGQTFTLTKKTEHSLNARCTGPGAPGEYTKQPGMMAYYEICNRVKNQHWAMQKRDAADGVYAYSGDQWVGYENTDTIVEKAKYIKSHGFGGAVAWTIDLDDFPNRCCQGAFPLLRALNQELGLISDGPTQGDCTKPPTPSTPAPPETTTGVDSGAASSEHHHHEWTSSTSTTKKTTTSPWWTTDKPSSTTTKKPTTTAWWETTTTTTKKPTTVAWWETTTTTTKKPTTSAWWPSTTSKSTTPFGWWTSSTTPKTTTSKTTTSNVWWTPSSSTTTKKPTTNPWWTTTTTTKEPYEWSEESEHLPPPHPEEQPIIPPPGVIMPEVDKPSKKCEPGTYTADDRNCNAFYRCVLGELKKQYCAGGLHWNKERNVCDWPREAKCLERKPDYYTSLPTKPPKKATTATQWQTRTTTVRTTQFWTPSSQLTETSTPTLLTTQSPHTSKQKCNTGSYYPHGECNNFYVCFENKLIPQACAPGLSFDTGRGMCDWSFKVHCADRKRIAHKYTKMHQRNNLGKKAQPYSACEGNTFAPLPGDCSRYMHCQWNKYEIRECAPGLHWNQDKMLCDWPKSARCTEDTDNAIPDIEIATGDTDIDIDEIEVGPPALPPSTEASWKPPSTTQWQWTPPSTTEWKPDSSTESSWEWHPPIPPTSEKPPLSEELKPLSGYFKIVCYFTNWAWYRPGIGKYLPEDIDENLCTHIVYGFAVLDFSNLVIKAHDSWADFDNQFYKRVVAYKAKGVKVSIAIGGWNDSQGDKYSRLVNNPSARRRFIENVLKFIEKYNFDGLDLDWEYPKCWQVDCKKGPDSDKPAFADFVRELKAAFKPRGYLLSSAVSPSKTVIDAGYDVPALAESLDWVAVMTYDFHGQWDKKTGHVAPLYYHPDDDVAFFNSNFSLHYWISEGVPRRKIVMGMPLYGQAFRLEKESVNGLNAPAPGPGEAGEYTRAAGFLAYYEICHNIKSKGWTVVQDPYKTMGPYAYKGNQWVSFDDKAMIRKKSEYIRKMDLGGGMIWALDLDDFKNRCGEGRHPLLTIIRNVLADAGSGQQEPIDESDRPLVKPPGPVEPEPEVPTVVQRTTRRPTFSTSDKVNPQSPFKVVCYFTNWAWYRQGIGKYLPGDIDPDLCTHVVYGFAVLDGDQLVIKPHDGWADFDNKFYEKVTALRAKGIKVLIAIGGWNDSAGDKYSKLVNHPTSRRKFIAHVANFIEENNFDGLDLDWEYPKCWQVDCNKGPHSDKPAFAEFVKELHAVFKPKGWLLSSAVSPSKRVIDAGYDVPALSKYLDWIAVMCYDYHGQWDKITGHVAPMYPHPDDIDDTFNTNFTIHYWIEQGADRKKLVMGMPMYGQSFSLADNNENGLNAPTYGGGEAGEETRARGFLAYYEICSNIIKKGWQVVRDRKGRIGPYAYLRDQWVSFDDIGMIRHKSEYIKAMGLGGGMIWALDLDDFKNICGCEEYPLLRTINRVLRGYSVPDPKCVLGKPQKPEPTQKPTWTERPQVETTPSVPNWVTQKPSTDIEPVTRKPCEGRLFIAHESNCNQYYLCDQGEAILLSCPTELYWNQDHCDWPENSQCHPDGSTIAPVEPIEEPSDTSEDTEVAQFTPEPPYFSTPETTIQNDRFKVVCYFTNWAWYRQGDGKYLPSDIDPELCTHINYGFAVLDTNSLTIKPHDSWADLDNEFYTKVTAYKAKGIKVLIAIGGWNDSEGDKYSRLVNNPQARARFVTNVIEFIEKYNFDGLDLDWEYPKCWQVDCNKGPKSDKPAFAELVRQLSMAFKPKGLLLSSAVSPSKAVIDAGYEVPVLSQYFDWIAIMTYDFHGHWDKQTGHVAPLYYYPGDVYDYFNANFSVNYWIEKGAPPEKLVMGMPLYGQSFSLADGGDRGLNVKSYGPGEAGEFTRAGGFLAFYEICDRVRKQGWTVTRDPEGRIGPYATHGNQWVSYDDISEVKRKSHLVKDWGLGGGMIWALDLDDFRNRCGCGRHPLLKTMNHILRNTPSDITLQNCT